MVDPIFGQREVTRRSLAAVIPGLRIQSSEFYFRAVPSLQHPSMADALPVGHLHLQAKVALQGALQGGEVVLHQCLRLATWLANVLLQAQWCSSLLCLALWLVMCSVRCLLVVCRGSNRLCSGPYHLKPVACLYAVIQVQLGLPLGWNFRHPGHTQILDMTVNDCVKLRQI